MEFFPEILTGYRTMLLLCNRTIMTVSICNGTSNKCLELEKVHKSWSFLVSSLVLLPELCAYQNFGIQTCIGSTSRRPELFNSDLCSLDLMMIFGLLPNFSAKRSLAIFDV